MAAADGNQAIAAVRQQHPDLVITDVDMPGRDGASFVEELRDTADGIDIPVVVLTGLNQSDPRVQRLMQTHMVDVKAKPYPIARLTELVGQLAQARQSSK